MEIALLIFLIIVANLTLYWVFLGKKKFEQKYGSDQDNTLPSTITKVK